MLKQDLTFKAHCATTRVAGDSQAVPKTPALAGPTSGQQNTTSQKMDYNVRLES